MTPRWTVVITIAACVACERNVSVVDAGCDPTVAIACYTGPKGTEDVGVCHGGTRHCTPDGQLAVCENEVTPQTEICNYADDDCNGLIDDLLELVDAAVIAHCDSPACTGDAAGAPITCWGPDPGICGAGTRICSHQTPASCNEFVHVPAQEICNGIDDDCNGIIDDGLDDDGPCLVTNASVLGECAHGRLTCVDQNCNEHGCADASDLCFPSGPKPEVCDGLDNDCNGVIDDGCDAGPG
jgi:hypothetical protein